MNLTAGIFCLPLLEAGNGHRMRGDHEALLQRATPRTGEHTWPDGWCVFAKPDIFVPKIPAGEISFHPNPQLWGIYMAVPEGFP